MTIPRARLASLLSLTLTLSCRHPGSTRTPADLLAEPQARYVLGVPADVPLVNLDPAVLKADPAARRAAGWQLFQDANKPVYLVDPRNGLPLHDADGKPLAIPLWQTWYDMTEFRRMLATMLQSQAAPAAPTPDDVAKLMESYHLAVLSDRFWAEETPELPPRLDRFIDSLTAAADGRALGGNGRGFTLFSPALIKHLLLHYRDVLRCAEDPSLAEMPPIIGACVGGPFPANAVAVKANWLRNGDPVPVFDTSAAALAKIRTGEALTWAASTTVQAVDSAYLAGRIQNLKKLGQYRLVGLSLTSKATPQWLWSTFWWHPDAGHDLGADNPLRSSSTEGSTAAVTASFPELANYKMCVASDYAEAEPSSETTWCSNPYIETQAGGADTNCIGCHQHAGPDRGDFEEIRDKENSRETFPADFLWSFDSFKESFKDEIVRAAAESLENQH